MNPERRARYHAAASGPDIAAFIDAFELRGNRPVSVENYENDLARLPEMFPDLPLGRVTDAELAQVFRTSRRTRRIAENPMDYFEPPRREPRKRYDIFSDAETDALLDLPVLDSAPLALLFDAGLRRDELRNMRLRHCDPAGGLVKVLNGKGGKDREIPMPVRLRNRLADAQILEGLDLDDYLLYGSVGNAQRRRLRRDRVVGEATFVRWWYRCLDTAGVRSLNAAGVRHRNPHLARHTFATRWRRLGLDPDYLAYILGHESVRTTIDTYVHTDIQDVAREMRRLDPALFV
jgi:integrase/recombinase XerD